MISDSVKTTAGSMVSLLKASETVRVNRHSLAGDSSFAEVPLGDATLAVELLLDLGVFEGGDGYMVTFRLDVADRLIAEHHSQLSER